MDNNFGVVQGNTINNDQDNFYTIEKILRKNKFDEGIKYLVKWVGYSVKDSTWEPIENLENVIYMVEDFEKELSIKKNYPKTPYSNRNYIDDDKSYDGKDEDERKEKIKKSIFKSIGQKTSNQQSQIIKKTHNQNNNINNTNNSSSNDKKVEVPSNLESEPRIESDIMNDSPNKVINAKFLNKELMCLIEWNPRSNGITPDPSYHKVEYFKKKYPKLLIDFFETKLKFV